MKYGLGIDTGGTYTDAVIYDIHESRIIHTAKSLTVKENLALGINNVLDMLPKEMLEQVRLVSLSTTLATNACVEGKGARSTLILIGCDEETVKRYGSGYGLPPVKDIIFVSGGHNQKGDLIHEPDWKYLETRINEYKHRTDSFVITQMWGMRNPEFEKKAKDLINGWTGMPVLCAHELLGNLNFLKRSASALLNAQLIPLISEFIDAMKTSLRQRSINAPIVIVRGDGSLMSEEFAREKPIETLLSGPASSVAGGIKLSRRKDCIIVDMGGTTSDLAVVKEGNIKLAYEGIPVGNWIIGTKAIQMRPVGLGGDSRINTDSKGGISIGPVRVTPLSWLAFKWPGIISSMKAIITNYRKHTHWLLEFFYLLKDISDNTSYSQEERKIAMALKDGPLSILELAEAVGSSIYEFNPKKLEQNGIIMRSGLTPTDIMHITGKYDVWSTEAASLCTAAMAERLEMYLEDFIDTVNQKVKETLYFNIVKLLLDNQDEYMLNGKLSEQAEGLIMMGYRNNRENMGKNHYISLNYSTDLALVGIGAPIHVFLPDVAKSLGTECIIPENAAVANAIGAITGNVTVEESVIIRPRYETHGINGYICYSSLQRKEFSHFDEALEWSKELAYSLALDTARARGSDDIIVTLTVNDNSVDISKNENNIQGEYSLTPNRNEGNHPTEKSRGSAGKLLLETVITARASGSIKWI